MGMRLRRGTACAVAALTASAPAAGVTLTHRGTDSAEAAASSYTVSDAALGTAEAGRVVVVGFYVGVSSGQITGVTVGGVSATSASHNSSNSSRLMEIWYAVVPTGTTGDIVVSHNSTGVRYRIDWWTIHGSTQTTPAAVSDNPPKPATSNTITSSSLTVPSGGCAIAVSFHNNNAVTGGETTWTISAGSINARTDARAGSGPWFTTADTTQTGAITVTATNAQASALIQIAAIAWGP